MVSQQNLGQHVNFGEFSHSRSQRLGSTQGSGKLCLGEHAP